MVPSDSTLSLHVTAAGYAKSIMEMVSLASERSSSGFDVVMLPQAKVDELNRAARPGTTGGYGIVAVTVRSLSGRCAAEGTRLALLPSALGIVSYAKKGDGMMTDPDSALTAVERTEGISAWLTGVVPPGHSYSVVAEKAGCAQAAWPLVYQDRSLYGVRKIEAGAFTQLNVFLE